MAGLSLSCGSGAANRTVVRVTLVGRDVGSELVATGVARWWPRWQRKPDWCVRARR
jgi:micrococcal nuclease